MWPPPNEPDKATPVPLRDKICPPSKEADKATLVPLMDKLLDAFQHLPRLSGSAEAEQAVDELIRQLEDAGLSPERKSCQLYLSDPIAGSLVLPDFPQWQGLAKTRSFSASCPEGISAPLIYDERSLQAISDSAGWESAIRGRIVIADQGFEEYVQRLVRGGALGLIHIWGSAEEALHEETVGPVWGAPVPDDLALYPTLPVISVSHKQGQLLLDIIHHQNQPVIAKISTMLNEHIAECSLPVVDIAGEIDEFVLLSSHYDSWHEGMTDNATGNALCLAVAAHFHHQPQSRRGLRIAWWPGHSNARYGGSGWYADHHRQTLQQNCVAHINVDSPGCKEATEVVVNASGAEDIAFLHRSVRQITGKEVKRITPLGKGGDQSFWGCGIPLHFAFREEPETRSSQSPGSGGGWWWHTEEDTRDKVDVTILWRDCQIHIGWLNELLYQEQLPVDPAHYLRQLLEELASLQCCLDPQFDLIKIREKLIVLEQQVSAMNNGDWHGEYNVINQLVAILHRVRYSSTDDFHFDRSYRGGAFPGLQILCGQRQETTSSLTFLAMTTQYIRQRDRALSLLSLGQALLAGH